MFEKKRHCGKQNFDIGELFIQCNKDNCYEHITVGVNIFTCVSLLGPECAVCFCVMCCLCVCVVLNQSTSKKPHYVLDLSKLIGIIVYTPSLFVRRGERSLANNKKNMQSLQIHWQLNQNLQKPCTQQTTPHPEIRQNPRTSHITKKAVNQFTTQIYWLVSISDELLSTGILIKYTTKTNQITVHKGACMLVNVNYTHVWEVM